VVDPDALSLVRGHVYPVPPRMGFPGIGVHMSKSHDGSLLIGPNAALAFAREAYEPREFSLKDSWDLVRYPGVRRLIFRHLPLALGEIVKDLSQRHFIREAQKYCPTLKNEHCATHKTHRGVHAIPLFKDGTIADDYIFHVGIARRCLLLRNAQSPSATASLALADEIIQQAQRHLDGWPILTR
jgi:L-2-hydroxyglutarate oxidase LhgO